jgi:hypothetical protein
VPNFYISIWLGLRSPDINDASLYARHLHTYALTFQPDDIDDSDAQAIEFIASTTLSAVRKLVKSIARKRQQT